MIDRRHVVTALAAFGLALGLGAAVAKADQLADIQGAGTIRVAVPQEFPPFGSVAPDMTLQGYDIDMAHLIAEKIGVTVELVPVVSTNRIPFLQTGRADIVISSLGKNEEREKVIDFSSPYAPFFNGVFGPADVDAPDLASLSGKTISVTQGSVEDLDLTRMAPSDAVIRRYEDNNGTISAFLSGQTQLMASGSVVAVAVLERNPPRRPDAKFMLKNSPVHVGIRKGEAALKERVDSIIAQAKTDGTLNAIAQKWLKADLPKDL